MAMMRRWAGQLPQKRWRFSVALLRRLCLLLILFPVITHATEHGVVVLQYHHVGDDTPRVTSVTAAELDAHFAYLQEHDFNVVSLAQAQRLVAEGKVPNKTVAITFDDSWRNIYTNGRAVFEKYRYPFTIFVNPYLMEETPRLYMSWQQLKELTTLGATIANHSEHHAHMTWRHAEESPAQWRERQQQAIVRAQEKIDAALGAPQAKYFAYPFGEYNPELAELLEQLGYLAFGQHSGAWGGHTPATEIPRFPASGQYADLKTLVTKLNSLPLPAQRLKPVSMVQSNGIEAVTIVLQVEPVEDVRWHQLGCFYQGERYQPELQDEQLTLQVKALPIGRSRVNCTAPSRQFDGRFYWYSIPLIRPDAAGRWPD